jgi:teichuronic acid biosynthesis glycosyltransferase TuaH
MNFIFVSLQRINTDRESTSTSLAKELSKEHNVLYVNSPIDRKSLHFTDDPYVKEHIAIIRERKTNLVTVSPSFHILFPNTIIESINWVHFNSVFNVLNRVNNRRFAKDIQGAIDSLGFESFIIINDKDIFRSFYLKELLRPALYMYLDRDNTLAVQYWKKHGSVLEPALMRKSDAVLCNSPAFREKALKYNKHSYYIGNGCGLDVFDSSPAPIIPVSLQDLKKPIIGYVGALISSRLDLALIIEIAKLRSDWNFVFIGPTDREFESSQLYKLPNVLYLGKIHAKEIPSYISAFDVCINPQIINEITDGNFPLKIVEYLALGKPTIATSTRTMKEIFSEFTYLGFGSDEYIQLIELALKEDSEILREKRRLFAREFGWDRIADNLLSTIKNLEVEQT